MVGEGDCVAVFHSVHRVMKAEKLLKASGVEIVLLPVPRQLSADCGLVIRFAERDRSTLEAYLSEAGMAVAEIWRRSGGEYDRLV